MESTAYPTGMLIRGGIVRTVREEETMYCSALGCVCLFLGEEGDGGDI